MGRGSGGLPHVLSAAGATALVPIDVLGGGYDEGWLQGWLEACPQLLPLADLAYPIHGPLVSLGREIASGAGPIDNLFANAQGDLVVVETKLWKNPEARRTVVAQVLDYGVALSKRGIEHLGNATGLGIDGLCSRIASRADGDFDDARFVDRLTRNLRDGRILLLIVGDGIREKLSDLAETLGRHPGMHFHLELIELRLFARPGTDEVMVVPQVVGRTAEVERAVVTLRTGEDEPTVDAPQPAPAPSGPVTRIESLEAFLDQLRDAVGEQQGAAGRALVEWWTEEIGGALGFGRQSCIRLLLDVPGQEDPVTVALYETRGVITYLNTEIAKRVPGFDADESMTRSETAGFEAGPKSAGRIGRPVNLADSDEWGLVTDLLAWAATEIQRSEA